MVLLIFPAFGKFVGNYILLVLAREIPEQNIADTRHCWIEPLQHVHTQKCTCDLDVYLCIYIMQD